MKLHEVGDVLRHQRPRLGGRKRKEVSIGEAVQLRAFASGDDIVTTTP